MKGGPIAARSRASWRPARVGSAAKPQAVPRSKRPIRWGRKFAVFPWKSPWNVAADFATLPPHFYAIRRAIFLRASRTPVSGKICVKLRHHSIVFCVSLVVLAPILSALAAPWDALPTRKKVDADPHNMYPITQSSGPWMIMAATFQGETAQKQAQALVYELRSKFNLPAYTYEKTFDYTKPEQGAG